MNKKRLVFGAIALVLLSYLVFAYIYMHVNLIPSLVTITPLINTLSIMIVISFIVIGLYHLYLLYLLLRMIPHNQKSWKYSIGIFFVILSGITLISDAVGLLEIGKEYIDFNVSMQWYTLYFFLFIHIVSIVWAIILTYREDIKEYKFFETLKSGNDMMFKTLYQIIFVAGVTGTSVSIMFLSGLFNQLTYPSYLAFLVALLGGLIVLPVAIFLIYWLVKNRNKPLKEWMDENEWIITLKGMVIAMLVGWIVALAGIILTFIIPNLQLVIWLIMAFFIQITFLSFSVITKINIKE